MIHGLACIGAEVLLRISSEQNPGLTATTLGVDTLHPPIGSTREVKSAAPIIDTEQPSLGLGNATANADTTKATAAVGAQQDGETTVQDSLSDLPISMDQRTSNSTLACSSILAVAADIGLQIAPQVQPVIQEMYTQWQDEHKVASFNSENFKLQQYYSNIITLYILGYAKGDTSLDYAILVQFQGTNYEFISELPDIDHAIYAFTYLPPDDPLCRWIAILFAFLWGTQETGDYQAFMKDNPCLDSTALAKLLYGVAYFRDQYTMGHDIAVLGCWCDVHNHDGDNASNKALCESTRSKIQFDLKSAQEEQDSAMLNGARRLVERYLASVSASNVSLAASSDSSSSKRRRKAEQSPGYASKRSKRQNCYLSEK